MVEPSSKVDIGEWWNGVLAGDEAGAKKDETYSTAMKRRLRCVFCDRHLEEPLREALGGGGRKAVAMVAYWRDEENRVFATGLYCHGVNGCLHAAKSVAGYLGDAHAEQFLGGDPLGWVARTALDKTKWEPSALRRLVLLCTALAEVAPSAQRGVS